MLLITMMTERWYQTINFDHIGRISLLMDRLYTRTELTVGKEKVIAFERCDESYLGKEARKSARNFVSRSVTEPN